MEHTTGIAIDPTQDAPMYQQIADQLSERIRRRALPPGFRLPPTRELARQLKTHRNTVVRAFEILQSAGYVISTVGRGTFVAPEPPAPPSRTDAARDSLPWGALLSRAATAAPLARLDRLSRGGALKDAINLQGMQPSADVLPSQPFRRCINHVMRTLGPRALGYAPRDGLERLRVAIATQLVDRGIGARPEDVLITSGSQQALDLIARALVNPGEPFLLEEPTYSGAINLLSALGAGLIGVPHDGEGPDLASLERLSAHRPKGLYLMPGGRNPTGTWIGGRRREALIRWSRSANVPILEDDFVADLVWDEDTQPLPLRALDPEVIYFGSFSKNLIPALRIGFVVCPPPVREHLIRLKHAADLGTSLLLQHALAEMIERGELRAHLRRTAPIYRARLDALLGALEANLPKDIRWSRPKSGFAIWLALPRDLDPEELFLEAQRHGVQVNPGTLSSVDGAEHAGVRLTFCTEPEKRLVEGAARLGAAVHSLRAASKKARPRTMTVGLV